VIGLHHEPKRLSLIVSFSVVGDDISREVVDDDTFLVVIVVIDRAGIPIAKEFVDGATNDTIDSI